MSEGYRMSEVETAADEWVKTNWRKLMPKAAAFCGFVAGWKGGVQVERERCLRIVQARRCCIGSEVRCGKGIAVDRMEIEILSPDEKVKP